MNVTMSQVLLVILKIFDFLGLVAFVIIKAKIFMHKLCLLRLYWDDFLSEKKAKEWREFSDTL